MTFTYNSIAFLMVTVDVKPWTHSREFCKALEHGKTTKTAASF